MQAYKLTLKYDNDVPFESREDSIRNQVIDYITLYNGNPGLELIKEDCDMDDMYHFIGSFVTTGTWDDLQTIHGLLFYEDDFGDFVEGYVMTGTDKLLKIER